uniref:DUF6598 domain-containing protein n=1 Tax=Arundo donax TaxID=35708 RepID=A0A0A9AJ01_ARUDO
MKNSEEWDDVNARREALRRRVVAEKEAVARSPVEAVDVGSPEPPADPIEEDESWCDLFAPAGNNKAWGTRSAEQNAIPLEELRKAERERAMAWAKWNEEEEKAHEEEWLNRFEIQASKFRDSWMALWSSHCGSFDATTEIKNMRFTDKPAPIHGAYPCDTLQIFSVKVAGIRGGLQWPLDVFGMIAVRDSIDQRRNIIFKRERDNCQTLTEKDSCLVLAGPTRAVVVLEPVTIEVELKVKGTAKSEDKDLSSLAVPIVSHGTLYPRLIECDYTSKLSTLEFILGHIIYSVEATIFVRVIDGSWPDGSRCQFAARATSDCDDTAIIDGKEIILLDSRDDKVPFTVDDGGNIKLSRCVASVEVTGKLFVSVKATVDNIIVEKEDAFRPKEVEEPCMKKEVHTPMEADSSVANEVAFTPKKADRSDTVDFTPKEAGESNGILDVGFCKMKVTVAWSIISCERQA